MTRTALSVVFVEVLYDPKANVNFASHPLIELMTYLPLGLSVTAPAVPTSA
jgi:hypothetical protein